MTPPQLKLTRSYETVHLVKNEGEALPTLYAWCGWSWQWRSPRRSKTVLTGIKNPARYNKTYLVGYGTAVGMSYREEVSCADCILLSGIEVTLNPRVLRRHVSANLSKVLP